MSNTPGTSPTPAGRPPADNPPPPPTSESRGVTEDGGLSKSERKAQRKEDKRARKRDKKGRHGGDAAVAAPAAAAAAGRDPARKKFGGVNLGACLFGWLVAIGVAVVLTGLIGAVAAAVGSSVGVTQSEAEQQAGTIGVVSAIVLLLVLMVGYYCGGYVAGRMSRFDGGRQGIVVWVLGLVISLVAVGLGALFGEQYNVLGRVDVPSVPLSGGEFGWGAAITAVAVLIGTLVAAWLGGVVGRRYHTRVDRAVGREEPVVR